jgi:hypothetical protein
MYINLIKDILAQKVKEMQLLIHWVPIKIELGLHVPPFNLVTFVVIYLPMALEYASRY